MAAFVPQGTRRATPTIISLPKYAAAQALRAAGTRNAIVLTIGDSTNAGWGGSNLASQANSVSFSYPKQLAGLIPQGSWQSQFGDYNTLIGGAGTVTLPVFDPRVTLGSWNQTVSTGTTAWTVGGPMLRCTAGTTPYTFTPTTAVDSFDLYYVVNTGFGGFTWQVDSGAVSSTISQNGSQSIVKLTIPAGTAGTHTLKLARVSGTIFIVGVIAYNSAVKETTVINGGFSGSTVQDWNNVNGAWDPLLVTQILAPDLTIIDLTINNWVANTSSAIYDPNLQNIINAAKVSGDVILKSGVPSNTVSATLTAQQSKIGSYAKVAGFNSLINIDQTQVFVSWTTANANGYTFDNLHDNGSGYLVSAQQVQTAISGAGFALTSRALQGTMRVPQGISRSPAA